MLADSVFIDLTNLFYTCTDVSQGTVSQCKRYFRAGLANKTGFRLFNFMVIIQSKQDSQPETDMEKNKREITQEVRTRVLLS